MDVARSQEKVRKLVKMESLLGEAVRGLGLEPVAVCAYGAGAFVTMTTEAEAERVAAFFKRHIPGCGATAEQDDVRDGGGFYVSVDFPAT